MNDTKPRPQDMWGKQVKAQANTDVELVFEVLDRLDMSAYGCWNGPTRWEAAQQIVRALNTGIIDGR